MILQWTTWRKHGKYSVETRSKEIPAATRKVGNSSTTNGCKSDSNVIVYLTSLKESKQKELKSGKCYLSEIYERWSCLFKVLFDPI